MMRISDEHNFRDETLRGRGEWEDRSREGEVCDGQSVIRRNKTLSEPREQN